MIYGIKDWRTLYENTETRRRKNLGWVLTPNRHDSMAFGRLMVKGSEGLKIFGAWMILLQLSSRGPYQFRGILCDSDGVPYSIEDMAVKTRVLLDDLQLAIPILIELGWLFQTDSDLCTIYENNPPPYADTGDLCAEKESTDAPSGKKCVETIDHTQNSCPKNKHKNKKENKHPPTQANTKSKRGGGVQIPEELNNTFFLDVWSSWVLHLTQKQGRISESQLQSHLDELQNDPIPVACERLQKAIGLGFRFPVDAEKNVPTTTLETDLGVLAKKIENEIGD